MICALGDWFGGYALFVVGGVVHFTFARAADALHLSGGSPLTAGTPDACGCRMRSGRTANRGAWSSPSATGGRLDGRRPACCPSRSSTEGPGLRLGYDSGFPVSRRYPPPARFTGVIHYVKIDTPGSAVARPADEMRTALHAD